MPRDGAIIFGKLDALRVGCDKCGRDCSYRLDGLIEKRRRVAKLIDWLDKLTAECPKKIAHNTIMSAMTRSSSTMRIRGGRVREGGCE